jgi:hypothetical protein
MKNTEQKGPRKKKAYMTKPEEKQEGMPHNEHTTAPCSISK